MDSVVTVSIACRFGDRVRVVNEAEHAATRGEMAALRAAIGLVREQLGAAVTGHVPPAR